MHLTVLKSSVALYAPKTAVPNLKKVNFALHNVNFVLHLVMHQNVKNHIRRHRRYVHEMTQQELADRVGVSRQTIVSIEKGRYSPSVGLALKLAEVLGVTVEALFELDREEEHD